MTGKSGSKKTGKGIKRGEADAPEDARKVPMPSNNPTTNLLIADVVIRSASLLFRKNIEKRLAKASGKSARGARKLVENRGLLKTVGLYGASRLATRSVPGLMVVTGGLVAKTLYDRGKQYQERQRKSPKKSVKKLAKDIGDKT